MTDVMRKATTIPTGMPRARMAPLLGCMTPCRIVVDLGHPELPIDLLHLHHNVDEDLEPRAYVLTRQVCAAFAFLHQQRQLLDDQFGRLRVDRRNRTGMTAIDVAQVEKCGPIAQLLKKNAVGSHPEGAFQQRSEERRLGKGCVSPCSSRW